MAIITKPAIKLEDLGKEIEHLSQTFSARRFKAGFTDKAEKIMLDAIAENFETGSDVDGVPWKSDAKSTKLGGRYAVDYNKQPSGKKVSSGTTRLTDTGVFRRSWKVISRKFNRIVIGPVGTRNQKIAQAALDWGNRVGGFGKKQQKALNELMKKYLKDSAVNK